MGAVSHGALAAMHGAVESTPIKLILPRRRTAREHRRDADSRGLHRAEGSSRARARHRVAWTGRPVSQRARVGPPPATSRTGLAATACSRRRAPPRPTRARPGCERRGCPSSAPTGISCSTTEPAPIITSLPIPLPYHRTDTDPRNSLDGDTRRQMRPRRDVYPVPDYALVIDA